MPISEIGNGFDGIQSGVFGQRVWDDFQRLGKGSEAVLLHAGQPTSVLHELETHFRFRGAAAGDESAPLDQASDDAEGVVERSISFVEDELVGAAEKDGDRLAGGGRSDAGDLSVDLSLVITYQFSFGCAVHTPPLKLRGPNSSPET